MEKKGNIHFWFDAHDPKERLGPIEKPWSESNVIALEMLGYQQEVIDLLNNVAEGSDTVRTLEFAHQMSAQAPRMADFLANIRKFQTPVCTFDIEQYHPLEAAVESALDQSMFDTASLFRRRASLEEAISVTRMGIETFASLNAERERYMLDHIHERLAQVAERFPQFNADQPSILWTMGIGHSPLAHKAKRQGWDVKKTAHPMPMRFDPTVQLQRKAGMGGELSDDEIVRAITDFCFSVCTPYRRLSREQRIDFLETMTIQDMKNVIAKSGIR